MPSFYFEISIFLFLLKLLDGLEDFGEFAIIDFDAVVKVEFDAGLSGGIEGSLFPAVDFIKVFLKLGEAFDGAGLFVLAGGD